MLTTITIGRLSLLRASMAVGASLGFLIVLMTLLRYPASPSQTLLYYVALALLVICIVVYRLSSLLAYALPLVAGAIGAYSTQRVRSGIAVGFWSGLISGLIAFLTLLAVAYLFMGPIQHDPQTLQEYAHSGERTLSTYIVGDFLFGACSHLLLFGMIYGTIMASIGAIVGKAAATSTTHQAADLQSTESRL